ncbi:hypothetical protein MUK70_18020 [Dyadobacter chenwenxiniae]|uniref:Por secretion system C-terminal sorting domain-containing protein n=1 Tax=Dyadobacter chenwenxiniae TaxID=2906456 RepID=A0A9X1TKD4_9BACT|nr:hypothetical protein [Dyadobacter chenwenxiniae]MCF0053825.1 hypothetical protein [Dyadobacter chenwenxiniae]MCF0061138.1 hypothetical protein [Dyadobacter chenwenxiniae]UON80965.1 hypothetical protein MUK70_18020 [Dyadobacter chenwenxiniae]
MKTTIKTFAFALAFIASTFAANAEDKETKKASSLGTGIYPTKNGKINVLVNKANNNANTVILLKNEAGIIVYRETVSRDNQKFGRTLNMDQMDAGKYEVDVISGKEIQSKSFELSEQRTERILTVK